MFTSTIDPTLHVNRYGVVFVPNGDQRGCDYYGKSFPLVPLRSGLLTLADKVIDEASAAGFEITHE